MIKITTQHTLPDGSTKENTFDLNMHVELEKLVLETINQRNDNLAMLCGISFEESIMGTLMMRQILKAGEAEMLKRVCQDPHTAQA